MTRLFILLFGLTGYAVFFATFLYLIGFVSGLVVPVTLDSGGKESPIWLAALINVGLVALFGIQHTIMARPRFKRWLTQFVPAPIERTVFMFVTCAIFALMFTQWRPIGIELWSLEAPWSHVVLGVAFAGWGLVLLSTFLIDHFDLFGLRQTWLGFRGLPYTQRPFQERSLYRHVRHPLMLGFLIAFWAAPTMTVGHLIFATSYTVYILLALFIEERDLVELHGPAYREYQRRVPKLLPFGRTAPRPVEKARPVAG